jgi:hypothetical protein
VNDGCPKKAGAAESGNGAVDAGALLRHWRWPRAASPAPRGTRRAPCR